MFEEKIQMPRMGTSVHESTILSWKKKEGDYVKKGESILYAESDKIEFETVKSSTFKDSGSPYRGMTDLENQYFQSLINDLYNQFAISYDKTKDYRDMIFILNEGLNFNPNNQNIIYYLGLAYYEIGFYSKAIQLLKNYYLYNNHP